MGFYTNRLEGPGGPNGSDTGIRMKLAWTPTDQTSVDLKVEHDQFDSVGPDTAEIADVGGPPLFVYQIPSPNFTPELDWIVDVDCTDIVADRDTDGDGAADTAFDAGSFCPSRDQESSNVTLTIEHDFTDGDADLDQRLSGLRLQAQFRGTRHGSCQRIPCTEK